MDSPHVTHGQIMEFNNSAEELVNHDVKPEVISEPGWVYAKGYGKDWNLLCIRGMFPTWDTILILKSLESETLSFNGWHSPELSLYVRMGWNGHPLVSFTLNLAAHLSHTLEEEPLGTTPNLCHHDTSSFSLHVSILLGNSRLSTVLDRDSD